MWGVLADFASNLWGQEMAGDRQEDQQQFNADQQGISNAFNAEQAAKNRDWQERMSNTAIQRRMQDLQLGGINPLLAAGPGQGAQIGSGGQASSGMASSGIASPTPFHSVQAGLTSAAQADAIAAQEDLTRANTAKTQAEEKEIIARTPVHEATIDQMRQNIEQSKNLIVKMIQETETSAATAQNLHQQTTNLRELIPQIQATVDQLRAHTKLTGAQTTLTGAQTGLAKAHTTQSAATTSLTTEEEREVTQRIKANLPKLEAALMELNRQKDLRDQPRQMQAESVADSFIGSLSATMQALNPFANIIPTIGVSGTGRPAPQPDRKAWKK